MQPFNWQSQTDRSCKLAGPTRIEAGQAEGIFLLKVYAEVNFNKSTSLHNIAESGWQIARKSRNIRPVSVEDVIIEGIVAKLPCFPPSWNQHQTIKDCFCCQIYCAQFDTPWTKLLGCPVQSLVGSPSTLAGTHRGSTSTTIILPKIMKVVIPPHGRSTKKVPTQTKKVPKKKHATMGS